MPYLCLAAHLLLQLALGSMQAGYLSPQHFKTTLLCKQLRGCFLCPLCGVVVTDAAAPQAATPGSLAKSDTAGVHRALWWGNSGGGGCILSGLWLCRKPDDGDSPLLQTGQHFNPHDNQKISKTWHVQRA
jgi:hypothetical protein